MEIKEKQHILSYTFNKPADHEMIQILADIADEVYYPKKSQILDMGDKADYVYLIVKGLARSYYLDENGNDTTKFFMQENEFMLGEALFMEESLETFETIENTTCLRFKASQLKKFLLSNSKLITGYIAMLEQTLIYKMNREYSFQCLTATERYLAFREYYPTIEERLPQSMIASYLGIAKESLSRIRKKLS